MKLIIDIPDSDYTAVRCEGLYYIGHDKLAESVTTAFQTAAPYEERLQGDLKSSEAIKAYARKVICGDNPTNTLLIRMFDEIIDNAPTVSPVVKEVAVAEKTLDSQWIPITFRQADDDEYKEFIERYDVIPREECKVCDCRMPDDGQEVLISTRGGHVYEDIFCADPDYYGFEDSDLDDVIAWMPKPKAYQKGGDGE